MAQKIKVMIPAYRVREKTQGAYEIAGYVNQMLNLIESDIEDALENEHPYAITELDTWFSVPYMNNVRAQRKVYVNLAQTLIRAKYMPKLFFMGGKAQSQRVFIYTTWLSQQEDTNEAYENEFLKSITVSKPLAPVQPRDAISLGKPGKKNREESSEAFKNFILKK